MSLARQEIVCGHPEREYVARGSCQACYTRNYRQYKPKYSVSQRKDKELRKKYGIGLEDKNKMIESQGGKCKICQKVLIGRDAHIDHCHSSGKVRGILCHTCNIALGMLGDTEQSLLRAVSYLRGDL